jgi:ABC-type branched-subunit amino acid transport system substrate-binding protein
LEFAEAEMLRSVIGAGASQYTSCLVSSLLAAGVGAMFAVTAPPVGAQQQTAKIAVALSLTGPNASIGSPDLDGIRLALEEANAAGDGPTIQLDVHDDASNVESGKKLAQAIGAGDALLVIGPATALETGRIYSDAGIVNIGPSTTGDEVTEPPNFFRAIASTSDAGEMLASYLRHVLDGKTAIVLYKDDGYGRATADGFRRAAPGLGIATRSGAQCRPRGDRIRGRGRPWSRPLHAPSAGRLFRHFSQRNIADGYCPVDVHGGFLPVDALRAGRGRRRRGPDRDQVSHSGAR